MTARANIRKSISGICQALRADAGLFPQIKPQELPSTYLFIHPSLMILPLKVKGKAVPLQAWSGPEGSRKLRLADFMTTAQDGGKVVSLTHRPHLVPGNAPGTHFC